MITSLAESMILVAVLVLTVCVIHIIRKMWEGIWKRQQ